MRRQAEVVEHRIILEHSQQDQYQNNDQDQSNPAAWSISPIPAVWPTRYRAQKQQHQND